MQVANGSHGSRFFLKDASFHFSQQAKLHSVIVRLSLKNQFLRSLLLLVTQEKRS
jgi:hypothetical protein